MRRLLRLGVLCFVLSFVYVSEAQVFGSLGDVQKDEGLSIP